METNVGTWCDVCGNEMPKGTKALRFKIPGVPQELTCHGECRDALNKAKDDWKKLPGGPLRNLYENVLSKRS